MNSEKFYVSIIIRVILITVTSLVLAIITIKTNYLYSIALMTILLAAQTWSLIRYILKRREDIKNMLEYIRENNPSLYFSKSRDYPFNELGNFLNEIGDIVRQVRIEKESQLQYMNYIVQHVRTGLISFDKFGNVEIINQAARDLLGVKELPSIHNLEAVSRGLPDIVSSISRGEQKVVSLKSEGRLKQLAISTIALKIGAKEVMLTSLQDIKNELDEKEMDSWQKLIRVLTHEIINSVTPVTSLTSTIAGFYKKDDTVVSPEDISEETIHETLTGLGYIEERGRSLIDFVGRFRSLTKLPVPEFEEVSCDKLFEGISVLKKDELLLNNITLKCASLRQNLVINCDRRLIEHVLLNLINNAADAIIIKNSPEERIIELTGSTDENQHPRIEVKDYGSGIPDNIMDNIFVPFYTTKEHGSGIGLSLSRQIMKLHGGTLTAFSQPGKETVFTLIF